MRTLRHGYCDVCGKKPRGSVTKAGEHPSKVFCGTRCMDRFRKRELERLRAALDAARVGLRRIGREALDRAEWADDASRAAPNMSSDGQEKTK